MTNDEIINMARQAGLSITPPRSGQYDGGRVGCDVVGLKRFAALVAAHEREQCSKSFKAFLSTPAPNGYDASYSDALHIWQAATAATAWRMLGGCESAGVKS